MKTQFEFDQITYKGDNNFKIRSCGVPSKYNTVIMQLILLRFSPKA